jgi:peptidoglycan/LPS O-acetylase OafA/YrhL
MAKRIPPLVWVGVASYSLYLWQQLFLCRGHAAWCTAFPQNLALAFATAAVSYYLVEQPLLRAREAWWRSRRSVAAVGAAATPREPDPGP